METLKDNNTDVILHFRPDSIKIRATDHANTNITYVHLYTNHDLYECERYQPVGVNIPKLFAVFKVIRGPC